MKILKMSVANPITLMHVCIYQSTNEVSKCLFFVTTHNKVFTKYKHHLDRTEIEKHRKMNSIKRKLIFIRNLNTMRVFRIYHFERILF